MLVAFVDPSAAAISEVYYTTDNTWLVIKFDRK